MKGNYADLNRIRKTITKHQSIHYLHPLTCGNDPQNHEKLVPQLELKVDDFELLLVCKDCNYQQDIPEFFTNEVIEDSFG